MSEPQEGQPMQPQVKCLCCGLGPKVTAMLEWKSETAREHFRNARIEFLKAIRTLIDERIEYLTRARKGTTVPVE
ncbi:MAG: hypothetical protein RMK57_16710 [Bryobacterales bacterium]|nr:hypothetical protein [Bryobacteraceae bacterium]MDW8356163.1 hypothetical protein [Bryobacterales bacterium]